MLKGEKDVREPKKRTISKAPKGQIYVCSACSKTFEDPYRVDVSCMLNRVLCYEDSLEYEDGRVIKAKAVEEDNEQNSITEEPDKSR